MTDAERSALTALLGELRPETSIEVGTYQKAWNPFFWGPKRLAKLKRKVRSIAAGSLKALAPGLYSRLKH